MTGRKKRPKAARLTSSEHPCNKLRYRRSRYDCGRLGKILCMLQVHISSHLDAAFAQFWDQHRPQNRVTLRKSVRPNEQHLVVNPTTGDWLTQAFARQQGISVNQKPQFLASYLWRLLQRADQQLSDQSPFEPPVCVWAINQYLQRPSAFASLEAARAQVSVLARFELAQFLAALFDRYLVFRLDWLSAWEHSGLLNLGEHEAWQAHLWRHLLKELPGIAKRHPFESLRQFTPSPDATVAQQLGLPERIVVWSMDSVAPIYWDILVWLSAHTDVHLMLFHVSDVFVQDLVSRKQWLVKQLDDPVAYAYLELGHPLLAQWGRLFAEQQRNLLDRDIDPVSQLPAVSLAATPVSMTQLQWLQRSIALAVRPDDEQIQQQHAKGNDPSLRLFCAHNIRRQLQCLHEQLVQWLVAGQGQRKLSDVAIVCTDLAQAQPYIYGVFTDMAVRFSQQGRACQTWIDAMLGWLALVDQSRGPTTAQQLLNWLQLPAAATLFGVTADEVTQWQAWLSRSAVRYLTDWPAGQARLLLGLVVEVIPSQNGLRRQPVQVGDESDMASLALLSAIIGHWKNSVTSSAQDKTLEQWQQWFEAQPVWLTLNQSLANTQIDFADARSQLSQGLRAVAQNVIRSGTEPRVNLAVMAAALQDQLATGQQAASMSGALTFASVDDLRHRPFKLIAWVGLDDGVFPRTTPAYALDLMANKPRWGDQPTTVKDRGIFLESLMLAQEHFWMFYNGRDLRRNEPLNPSAVITDLCRFMPWLKTESLPLMQSAPVIDPKKSLPDWPLVSHVVNYGHTDSNAPQTEFIDVVSLQKFVKNPARFYAKHALGVSDEWRPRAIANQTPWAIKKSEAGKIHAALFTGVGQALIDNPRFAPEPLASQQQALLRSQFGLIELKRLQLAREQDCSIEDGIHFYPDFVLAAWVAQLARCAHLTPSAQESPSPLILFDWSKGEKASRLGVIEPKEAIDALHRIARLQQQATAQPILLFPGAALAWAKANNRDEATTKVAGALGPQSQDSDRSARTDLDDPITALVWRGQHPDVEQVIDFCELYLSCLRTMIEEPEKS
jgi:exonuclease V gamma subunit